MNSPIRSGSLASVKTPKSHDSWKVGSMAALWLIIRGTRA